MTIANKLKTPLIYATLICAAYLAGFFLTYAYTIMPGLDSTDDRIWVGAFQGLENVLNFGTEYGYNWPVYVTFWGGPVLALGALVLNRDHPRKRLIVVAGLLLLSVVATTALFNVPSNLKVLGAGDPFSIDATQVRADFHEGAWKAWNIVRTIASAAAFGLLLRVLHRESPRVEATG